MLIADRQLLPRPGLTAHVAVIAVAMTVFVTSSVPRGTGVWVYRMEHGQHLKKTMFLQELLDEQCAF
jgi:hypothetical protein